MNRRALLTATTLAVTSPLTATASQASPAASPQAVATLRESGYVPVGDLEMYYERHGSGAGVPLVMLHGAFGSISTYFAELLPRFAADRTVIGLELQGHGHTADIDRPLRYDTLAADVHAAIAALGYDQVDVFGYSMGGVVATTLAVTYPAKLRKIAIASAHWNNDGWRDVDRQAIENLNPSYFPPEFVAMVEAENPEPGNFEVLVAKIRDLDLSWPGFTAEQVATIPVPVLIMAGDSDGFTLAHIVEMYTLLGGGRSGDLVGLPASRLSILPGASHTGLLAQTSVIHTQVTDFLTA